MKKKTCRETHKILGEEQSGFRKGRGGLENISTLTYILDKNWQHKNELYLVFIDIEMAYDSVNRHNLVKSFKHKGVDERIVRIIAPTIASCPCPGRAMPTGKQGCCWRPGPGAVMTRTSSTWPTTCAGCSSAASARTVAGCAATTQTDAARTGRCNRTSSSTRCWSWPTT